MLEVRRPLGSRDLVGGFLEGRLRDSQAEVDHPVDRVSRFISSWNRTRVLMIMIAGFPGPGGFQGGPRKLLDDVRPKNI